MKTLYKRAKKGKLQQWSIEVDRNQYITREGYVDGKITTSKPTVCIAKNVGKSNETSPEQQAESEALSKWKKKQEKGYVQDPKLVDNVFVIEPMLAHKWSKYKSKIRGVVASQPKLDGIRCIATKNGLFTRTGKKILAAPHIERLIAQILEGLDDNVMLDGELYNHSLKDDFNKITSIVRKSKLTTKDIETSLQLLQYHVYDIINTSRSFSYRFEALKYLIPQDSSHLKLVPTYFYENINSQKTQTSLDKAYQQYLADGYEGQMIRKTDSQYEKGKRSKNLLKRKEFIDQEFEIIDIEEGIGNRSGMMGRVKFKNFDANARGSHQYFKELLVNKHKYVGKMATVRYQNLTPDGIPRFPVMIAIRDYE